MYKKLVFLRNIFLNKKAILFLGLFILAVFCISQQQLFKNINLSNSDNIVLASPGCNPDNCAVYGTICCSGSDNCINWTNDNNNCGGCGIRCINGQTCVYNSSNQTAKCVCQESNCNYYGTTCCNNQCANIWTDPNNCGNCGNRCVSGQTCQSGSCICQESLCNQYGAICCNNACANIWSDPNNCGSCGNRCGTGYKCSNAQCVDGSPPAINITSPANNATVSGTVDIKADASDPQSSVEWVRFTVKKTTSTTGTQICEDNYFPYSCSWDTTGFTDGSYYVYASARSTGGENARSIIVKVQNGSPAVCDPQACAVYGTICCTGSTQCINWTNDPNNCGGCGKKCTAGQTCSGGSCRGATVCNPKVCAVYGTICCTGSTQCINWTNDPNNCGGCGIKCAAGQTCTYNPITKQASCQGGVINKPPTIPSKPSGPTSGTTNTSYTFSTSTTDPNGDQVQYGWDWDGNGTVDEWSTLKPSGAADSRPHSWSVAGTYYLKVKAQDSKGAESGWTSSLTVTITVGPPGGKMLDVIPLNMHDYYQYNFDVLNPLTRERKHAYLKSQQKCTTSCTIANAGCAPVSVEMIFAYHGKGKGVMQMADAFTSYDCHRQTGTCPDPSRPFEALGSNERCPGIYQEAGMKATLFTPRRWEQITDLIDKNYPVLLVVNYASEAGGENVPHAVVAKGYEKNAQGVITKLFVNDPNAYSWKEITDISVIYYAVDIQ